MKRISVFEWALALSLTLLPVMAVPMVQAENTFPFAVFEKMQQTTADNIIVSPVSLEQAIGMAANGAKGSACGELVALTGDESLVALNQRNQQMAALLNQHADDTLSYMRVANSVWHLPGLALQQPFRDSVLTRYNAYVDTANFATQRGIDAVNAWVCQHTDSLIEKILSQPDPELLVTLINATLFHGSWQWGLSPFAAGPKPFLNADGSGTNVEVVSMHPDYATRFYLDDELVAADAGFISEDYRSHYRVLFIMPRDYERMVPLTAERWHNLLQHQQSAYVHLQVPKFDVSCNKEMLPLLKEMGAFVSADFTGIAPGAVITSIVHSTRMTLDEEGMSAAAVTAIMAATGMPDPIRYTDFIVNRPFYVAIMAEGTDEPIFLAKICQLAGDACTAPTPQYITLGVSEVEGAASATKYLRHGRLYIQSAQGVFDATGRRQE